VTLSRCHPNDAGAFYRVIITVRRAVKLSLNRRVFSCCRKVRDEAVRMAGGRLFHACDAATGKARSPRVVHLCKYNGVADLLKTYPSPYVLPFRIWSFSVKDCGIKTGESQKLGSPGTRNQPLVS